MIEKVLEALDPLREQLVQHPLYTQIHTRKDVQKFTETHVFAVWDFMSLLKALQQHLTGVALPWTPTKNPVTRRFINEIVFGEESDVDRNGVAMSHYEMYLEAMQQLGASTNQVTQFVAQIQNGNTISQAFNTIKANPVVEAFINFTFEVIATQKPHVIAAVFTFGREDLIPDMFIELVKGLGTASETDKLIYYLERHIELDGDEHGPMSLKMIEELCGDDNQKWEEAIHYSKQALQQRILLWNHILENKEL